MRIVRALSGLAGAFVLALFLTVLVAYPVLAYLYSAPVAITESGGSAHTNLPVIIDVDVDGLIAGGFITDAGALDTRIETQGGVAQIHMAADDKVLAFVPSLSANSQLNWSFTTGNSVLSGFPVIVGDGGYVTVADHANLELGNTFEIEFEGWVDTSTALYPVVESSATSIQEVTSVTSHVVSLPGGIEAGDLLIILFNAGDNVSNTPTITWPGGWTSLASYGGAYFVSGAAYKVASGSEGSTVTVTTSQVKLSAHQSFRISNYQGVPVATTAAISTNAYPNPPSLSPGWGAPYGTLWLPFCTSRYLDSDDVTAAPTNYGDFVYVDVSSYPKVASARRNYVASSEDPGSFTASGSFQWAAWTIGIKGREALVSKVDSVIIYTDGTDLVATILGSTQRTVTASGPFIGEHIVTVWADGTNLGIDVDGAAEDTTALSGVHVPDNANNWVISNLPYMNYYKHTVTDDFPEVKTRSSARQNSDTTSHSITLPAGVAVGDLLLCIFSSDGNPTVSIGSGTGWTILDQGVSTIYIASAVLYKTATGSDALTLTTSSSQQSSHIVLRIEDGGTPTEDRYGSGWSGAANPPSHTASKAANHLWVAAASWNNIITPSAAPSSYSNLTTIAAGSASGASTATAERLLYAQTEDPGVFTSANEYNVAWTIAVPPINQVADVLRVRYELDTMISGTTLVNEENPGTYNGAITWGSNPSGVATSLGGLTPPAEEDWSESGTTHRDVLPTTDTSDWFDEDISVRLVNNPFRPIVTLASDNTTMTELQAWRLWGLAILLLVTVGTARMLHGHYLITGIACAGAIGVLVHFTIWPGWSLVFIIPAIVAGVIAERTPSL